MLFVIKRELPGSFACFRHTATNTDHLVKGPSSPSSHDYPWYWNVSHLCTLLVQLAAVDAIRLCGAVLLADHKFVFFIGAMYWTVHLEGGPRRVNHAAVVVDYKIYSFGGYCTGDSYRRRRPMDVHVLNTCNFRWSALPVPKQNDPQSSCVPYQRYGHTAVAYGSNIFVWGGRNDEAACNVLFCFDTSKLL